MLALLLALAQPAVSADRPNWERVTTIERGEVYLDREVQLLSAADGEVVVTLHLVLGQPLANGTSVLELHYLGFCRTGTLQYQRVLPRRANGRQVFRSSSDPPLMGPWSAEFTEGSVGRGIVRRACAIAGQ